MSRILTLYRLAVARRLDTRTVERKKKEFSLGGIQNGQLVYASITDVRVESRGLIHIKNDVSDSKSRELYNSFQFIRRTIVSIIT